MKTKQTIKTKRDREIFSSGNYNLQFTDTYRAFAGSLGNEILKNTQIAGQAVL